MLLYPVSEDFLRAVQENTRKYYWTGKITTKNGVVYDFGAEDIPYSVKLNLQFR